MFQIDCECFPEISAAEYGFLFLLSVNMQPAAKVDNFAYSHVFHTWRYYAPVCTCRFETTGGHETGKYTNFNQDDWTLKANSTKRTLSNI